MRAISTAALENRSRLPCLTIDDLVRLDGECVDAL